MLVIVLYFIITRVFEISTFSFYPTALNGCWGIVFTRGVRMVGRAGVRAGGRAGGRAAGNKFVRAVSQKP